MPVVIAWLGDFLLSYGGQMVMSALVSLGIGFATTTVASAVMPGEAQIHAWLGSAGIMADYIGWFGIDKAITIVLSAWAGRQVTDAAHVFLTSRRAKTS